MPARGRHGQLVTSAPVDPAQPEQTEPTVLRDWFGSPADGTFLAWYADHGLWVTLIVIGALVTWFVVHRYLRKRFASALHTVEQTEATQDIGSTVRKADFLFSTVIPAIVIGIAAVIGSLYVMGRDVEVATDFFAGVGEDILGWLTTSGLRIVLILVLGWVAYKVAKRFIPSLMLRVIRDGRDAADAAEASQKRAATLTAVFLAAINVLIIIVVVFTVLTELGVPVGPVLGGIGIAGIAIGFGAQHIVRDIITGSLILLENQYRQGDVVEVAGISGLVESINLRRTVLRDLEGRVHTIPHGEITTTTNFTKYWSRVLIDVGVAYKEDMEQVFKILNDIGMELANHPELGLKVIDPVKVLRLNSFDDSAITIRMLGVCKPMTQWELAAWMRVRIKQRFDEEGIEIPFPHRTFYWGDGQAKLPWEEKAPAALPEPAEVPSKPEAPAPDDFVDPRQMTPEQREAMLAEMVLAAQAAQQNMQRTETSTETRLPGPGS